MTESYKGQNEWDQDTSRRRRRMRIKNAKKLLAQSYLRNCDTPEIPTPFHTAWPLRLPSGGKRLKVDCLRQETFLWTSDINEVR